MDVARLPGSSGDGGEQTALQESRSTSEVRVAPGQLTRFP